MMDPNDLHEKLRLHAMWLRKERDGICADFCGADLPSVDLRGVDLRGAKLFEANLRHAQLNGAKLIRADLRYADLCFAKLEGAHLGAAWLLNAQLRGADLTDAQMCNAYMHHANLTDANLNRAQLKCADLRGAKMEGAYLLHVNMCFAKLEGVALPPRYADAQPTTPFFDWEHASANQILATLLAESSPDRLMMQEMLDYFLVFLNKQESLKSAADSLDVSRNTVKRRIESLEWAISAPGHSVVLIRTAVGQGSRNGSAATDEGLAFGAWLRANEKTIFAGYQRR